MPESILIIPCFTVNGQSNIVWACSYKEMSVTERLFKTAHHVARIVIFALNPLKMYELHKIT